MHRSLSVVRVLSALALFSSLRIGVADAEPKSQNISINVSMAEARIRMNGLPIEYDSAPGDGDTVSSSPGNYIFYCRNGENVLAVDATITKPTGSVEVEINDGILAKPLFKQNLTAAGTIEHPVTVAKLPTWTWTKADVVSDANPPGLLDAVAAFHRAAAAHDLATMRKMLQPALADQRAFYGSALGDPFTVFTGGLSKSKIAPLATDFDVTPSTDHRIFAVFTKTHRAPVQARSAENVMTLSAGQFWSRYDGTWLIDA
jgi:hypothetical protein